MRRKITEAHLLLIITFAMYMGYQWLMQWIPLHDVMFHVIMGQVMHDFPRGIVDADTISENRPQLSERGFLHRYPMPTSRWQVAVIISAYPVVVILNRFSMFFVKNQVMEVMPYMMRMGYFPMLFVMAVMPAFNEEFLCRGILYGRIPTAG